MDGKMEKSIIGFFEEHVNATPTKQAAQVLQHLMTRNRNAAQHKFNAVVKDLMQSKAPEQREAAYLAQMAMPMPLAQMDSPQSSASPTDEAQDHMPKGLKAPLQGVEDPRGALEVPPKMGDQPEKESQQRVQRETRQEGSDAIAADAPPGAAAAAARARPGAPPVDGARGFGVGLCSKSSDHRGFGAPVRAGR